MSGIVGWVDFQRDLTRDRATALNMTAALAHRGPDAEGLWVSPKAFIGHRRLAVYGTGGTYPVRVEQNGRLLAVGAHSGCVLNHRELRAELTARGHRFGEGDDGEVIVRACLEWGAAAAERLRGTFAAAVWDVEREELLLVRDRMGIEPLYYHRTPGGGIIFGSEVKAILANPLVEAAVDSDAFCEILTYTGTPGQTTYRGITRLRGGHLARVNAGGLSESCYWRLEHRPHVDGLETTAATIRELLEASVAENLDAEVPLCTLLSGGLDSSSLTVLADRVLKPQGRPLRTFTVNFVGHDKDFRPDQIRKAPDAPFVAEMVRHLGSEHIEVMLDPAELMDPMVRSAVLRAKDFPTPFGDMNASAYLLLRAVREHAPVVLTGEAADSLFQGVEWIRDPKVVAYEAFPWIALGEIRTHRYGLGNGLFDEKLLAKLDPLGWARERYHEAIAEVPHDPSADPVERRMREISYLHLTRFMENQNAHSERLAKAVGLQIRVPYQDERLVQYVFTTSWAMQNFDGREKSLLRAAVRSLLPQAVLDRVKAPFPVTHNPRYDALLRDELAELLADRHAPVLPLLDKAAAQQFLADQTSMAGGWAQRANVEMVLQTNSWLRQYGVRLMF